MCPALISEQHLERHRRSFPHSSLSPLPALERRSLALTAAVAASAQARTGECRRVRARQTSLKDEDEDDRRTSGGRGRRVRGRRKVFVRRPSPPPDGHYASRDALPRASTSRGVCGDQSRTARRGLPRHSPLPFSTFKRDAARSRAAVACILTHSAHASLRRAMLPLRYTQSLWCRIRHSRNEFYAPKVS